MNAKVIIDVIKFIIANFGTIKALIAELQRLFGGDDGKVKECLEGFCDIAGQAKPQPAPEPKPKRKW
jgi:hypothetical protein